MKFVAPSLIGLSLLVAGLSGAHAQVTIDMSKYTCDDFQQASLEERVINATWFSGFVNGRANNTKIDTKKFKANAEAVVNYCEKNPKHTIVRAIKSVQAAAKR